MFRDVRAFMVIHPGAQARRFATDRWPPHAGIDPYCCFIDRNSGDNVLRMVDPG